MKKKNLFGLLCLVSTLGLGGLTSCGNPATPSSTGSTDTGSSSTPDSSTEEKLPVGSNTTVSNQDLTKSTSVVTGIGQYENSWTPGSFYGVRVAVGLDAESKINAVNIYDLPKSDNLTDSWQHPAGELETLLKNYSELSNNLTKNLTGKTLDDVKSELSVLGDEALTGNNATAQGAKLPEAYKVIAGATQTEARIGYALKDAATNKTAVTVKSGEGTGTAGGQNIKAKVNVLLDAENKVAGVDILNIVAGEDGESLATGDKWLTNFKNSQQKVLASYLGLTKEEIDAIADGTEGNISAGATKSSNCVLAAVKAALAA